MTSQAPEGGHLDSTAIRKLGEAREKILGQLSQVIVGQQQVIEELLICLFSRGHCLLEGVPGLAKTLHDQHAVADAESDVQPHPVHARPDAGRHHRARRSSRRTAPPARANGGFWKAPCSHTSFWPTKSTARRPRRRPRLLEAMQERQVTVGRVRHPLADPFFVLATQNPIEQEGTYPLPEAQQDRFMFKVFVDYPSFEEEFEVARRTTTLQVRQRCSRC